MGIVSGGDLFAKALKREGVKCIFTLCGGHISPIFDACLSEGIKIVDVRHEQVATHAAAGWSRTTGEVGVAVITAGPGVTDAVSGIAEAFTAGCPMIAIGGRSPLADTERGSLQELDQIRLMEPITKWAKTIYEAKRIPDYVSTAFKYAMEGTPGPVFLDCPLDILIGKVEENEVYFPRKFSAVAEGAASNSQVRDAVNMLLNAERPVIVVGDGVFWSKADKEVKEFVELTGIPAQIISIFAPGAIPPGHPLLFAQGATTMADAVLTLGADLNLIAGFGRPPMFNGEAKFIQVHLDPKKIGYNRDADISIIGNPRTVLSQMIEQTKHVKNKKSHTAWVNELTAMNKAMEEQTAVSCSSDAMPIHPARLGKEIMDFVNKDAIIVLDGGDNTGGWFAPLTKPRFMGQMMTSGSLGCLGVGTGFALAAKLAHPDKQVLIHFGDGSFGLHAMEFDTFVRHNLPIVAVISNDGLWGMVKHWQVMDYGDNRCIGTRLKPLQRYDKVVEALGGYGEYVDKPENIKPALSRAFASGLPACVNVAVDPAAISMVTYALKEIVMAPRW